MLVLPLLGCDLQKLRNLVSFSLRTILRIGDQLVRRLRSLHTRDIVHQDIKPANFVLGREGHAVYIIDLGFASRGSLRPFGKNFGTTEFRSRDSHRGKGAWSERCSLRALILSSEPSKHDDVESLAYTLIALHSTLKWEDQDGEQCLKMKDRSPKKICEGLDVVFERFLRAARTRKARRPDYAKLLRILQQRMHQKDFRYDHVYDWTELVFSQKQALLPKQAE